MYLSWDGSVSLPHLKMLCGDFLLDITQLKTGISEDIHLLYNLYIIV